MKSLNTTRNFVIKYPRNTPRISRKRDWMDRNDWRKSPEATYAAGTNAIDQQFANVRNMGQLDQTPYKDFPNMMNRAGRVGIRSS